MNRSHVDKEIDQQAELESQFILRMPNDPAKNLKDALSSGSNLKDRFAIRLENDVRHGEVRVDHYLLPAKVVDLPTIVESLKTIDGKSFYKTADVSQMLLCKEEEDQITDEDTSQKKKKDPNKVDKKFLWPHGITPPTKNVRRRRFRKTLKKKYVEAPEIEKEVKRLLRVDNDAVSVKWEVINEEDELKVNKGVVIKTEKEIPEETSQNFDIEQDIFGGAVSDSDEETNINVLEEENSIEDNLSDSNSQEQKYVTEFTCEMFPQVVDLTEEHIEYQQFNINTYLKTEPFMKEELNKEQIFERMEVLQIELAELRARREQQENEITNIENLALKQRFQDILDGLLQDIFEKEQEYEQYQEILRINN